MLFTSSVFIFAFLPVTVLGFYVIAARWGGGPALFWTSFASLVFYGWWDPRYLILILSSIVVNFALGRSILTAQSAGLKKVLLTGGLLFNIGLIAYFKYAMFVVESVRAFTGSALDIDTIVLPLAISFFTFQQIAYLVDVYRGEVGRVKAVHYFLFVLFFPQLIAGPIIHHREMMPQFMRASTYRFRLDRVAVGLSVFVIGLFKKTMIADGAAIYVDPVFAAAQAGETLSFLAAWGGALAYTFQLYFDFSGYSDMALGLALLFGIRLPLNFYSPYRATSIIDFWRRWHITLSRFLRDYVYIPLGGDRHGARRRMVNLMATMLIGGLWHGAGWTFILWGAVHGLLLAINHGWRALWKGQLSPLARGTVGPVLSWLMTFTAIVFAWVLFRATSLDAAAVMLWAMVGGNGLELPGATPLPYFDGLNQAVNTAGMLAMVLVLPSTYDFFRRYRIALVPPSVRPMRRRLEFRLSMGMAVALGAVAAYAVFFRGDGGQFIYFTF